MCCDDCRRSSAGLTSGDGQFSWHEVDAGDESNDEWSPGDRYCWQFEGDAAATILGNKQPSFVGNNDLMMGDHPAKTPCDATRPYTSVDHDVFNTENRGNMVRPAGANGGSLIESAPNCGVPVPFIPSSSPQVYKYNMLAYS